MSAADGVPSAFGHLLSAFPPVPAGVSTTLEGALRAAIAEAVKGVGRTAPNPPVGCVLLDAGVVVAVGHHEAAGRPHAEVNALDTLIRERGPGAARGLTAVVTLEPCAHHGRTPPCADRLVQEGVARVVVGTRDPNPRVDGRGLDRLRAAGIEVVVMEGDAAAACRALIAPFTTAITHGRVCVVLKTATSLDGRVATRTGASRYITGPESRRLVHGLRDAVDAVVVGASTVIADDPALTVRDWSRDDGVAVRDPARVVLDRRATLELTARVFDPPGAWIVHEPTATPKPLAGVRGLAVDGLDPAGVVHALAGAGLTSVMVEAGPRLAAAFLKAGVVDELWWFQAPLVIGDDGAGAFGPLGVVVPGEAPRFERLHHVTLGEDTLTVWRRRP